MNKIIFSGPTISNSTLIEKFPNIHFSFIEGVDDIKEYLTHHNDKQDLFFASPPVAQGDIFRVAEMGQFSIGVIDGYFENKPSVWHKEILYALEQGCLVYGSSSMGALRAAELSTFGMIGVGEVYNCFEGGKYNDDDEVTVYHLPKEANYKMVSEAMVNIRATIDHALSNNIITAKYAEKFVTYLKGCFYKERSFEKLSNINFINKNNLDINIINDFIDWAIDNKVDIKKLDAINLINLMCSNESAKHFCTNSDFEFYDTTIWRDHLKRNNE